MVALVSLPPFALAQREYGGGAVGVRGGQGGWTGTVSVGRGPLRGRGSAGPCGFGNCFGRYGFRQGEYAGYGGYGGYGGYAGYWPGYYAPYFADDEFWSLQEAPSQPPPPPATTPSVIVMQAPQAQQQRAPAESPKLIEVPLTPDTHDKTANAAPASPAIFILANGERLQATQYTLTYDSLQLREGGRVRVIPLSAVNLNATVAANRQQGLDLQIPANRQQITLGF